MSLKRLTFRAKKSRSGLYSFNSNDPGPSSSTQVGTPKTITTPDSGTPALQGTASVKTQDASPGKDSPSRRKRLFGSLRSMSSLRSFRSKENIMAASDEPAEPETPLASGHHQESPTLVWNFEASPLDQPMFQHVSRPSSPDIHCSSPITVPMLNKQKSPVPARVPLSIITTGVAPSSLPVGTVPGSPAPLQIALERDSIPDPTVGFTPLDEQPYIEAAVIREPLPTPMPGTNSHLDVVAAPGTDANSTTAAKTQAEPGDYFSMCAGVALPESLRSDSVISVDVKVLNEEQASKAVIPESIDEEERTQPATAGSQTRITVDVSSLNEREASGSSDANSSSSGRDRLADNVAYVLWADPTINEPEPDPVMEERLRRNTWSRHTGLYDGTGYGTETSSTAPRQIAVDFNGEEHDMTQGPGLKGEMVGDSASDARPIAPVAFAMEPEPEPEPESLSDSKETLHDIIRAYSHPMLYPEEMDDDLFTYGSDFSPTEPMFPREDIPTDVSAAARAEAALALRVMNRSLGG